MFKFKLEFLVINMHHLSLLFRFLIESEEGLNFANSYCECVDGLFIITDGATDDIGICTLSVQTDIGLW